MLPRSRVSAVVLIALLAAPCAVSVRAQVIEGLGHTHPFAMSYDGGVVVGVAYSASSGEYDVYRWEVGKGLRLIEGAIGTDAESVSGDGRVLLGRTRPDDEGIGGTAFKWTDGEMTLLPALDYAGRANYDGSVIAGGKRNEDTKRMEAVVDGGANYGEGFVMGIDSAGINMVGYVMVDNRARLRIWPAGTDLGEGMAITISPDGNTVIGARADGTSFRWTRSGGVDLLIPGVAVDMTRDGAIIVGSETGVPFIWMETDGAQPLSDFLSERGVELEGWQLHGVHRISEDGNVLVGNGTNPQGEPEGWRVELCGGVVVWFEGVGGSFGDADRWSTITVPGTSNIATFVEEGSYSVSLNDVVENISLEVYDGVDLTLRPGEHPYTLTAECAAQSIVVYGGFLDLEDGTTEAAAQVLVQGTEPVLHVGERAKLVVDSDQDGFGCLVAGGDEGTEALLSVAGGGEIESHACTILGDHPETKGRVVVDPGAKLRTDTLVIGDMGEGALEMRGGSGRVEVNHLRMAAGEGSIAHAELGELSVLTFRDSAFVGMRGEATLHLTNTGVVGGGNPAPDGLSLLVLGQEPSGAGNLRLDDYAHFVNSDAIVGMNGGGRMLIESNASAVIRRIWIGGHLEGTTGQGTVGVTGEGSKLETRLIWIGRGELGILAAAEGGRVTADQITVYGNGASFEGEGGRITAPLLQVGGAPTAPKRESDAQDEEGVFADTLLLVGDGQQLEVEQFVMAPGGVLGGTGTFPLALKNTGILSPGGADGGATGTFRTAAAYEQDASGVLDIELSGTEAGQFDRLEIAGTATLGGTLRLRTPDGYLPEEGDRFEIVTAAAVSGAFDAIIQPFGVPVHVFYGEDNVVVEVLQGVAAEEAGAPDRPLRIELGQNYPNPFTVETRLTYTLVEAAMVRLTIFDMLGREVIRLVDGHLPAGHHEVEWQPGDLPSGLYICRLQSAGSTIERILTLVK